MASGSRAVRELRFEKGELTIADGKERYILIPLRAYGALYNSIEKIVGDAVSGILYVAGKDIGRGLAEEVKRRMDERKASGLEELARDAVKLLEELGFGKIELVESSPEKFVVRMYSSATSMHAKKGKAVCHLERGMLVGIAESILGKRYVAKEVKCRAKGDDYCEFIIMESKRGEGS
ncbi:MAG TPA: hypothetical protein EYP32_05715 [Aquificaceae bacterium]|nr:hypothetical protein [Aquificaceae bacterium]